MIRMTRVASSDVSQVDIGMKNVSETNDKIDLITFRPLTKTILLKTYVLCIPMLLL